MEEKYINSNELLEWGTSALKAVGVPENAASYVSKSLIKTSLWGIDSHGIARLPHYLNRIEAGSLNVDPQIKTNVTGPCTADLHGDHGLGIVVMNKATDQAISMALENGVGIVGVRESSHCGAIGIYGREIAQAGLIGVVFTHSDSFVAPHRGYKKFMGTNPICISAPSAEGNPVCLDMASSAIAFNYIMNARKEGRKIPDNVAYNEDGEITNNPDAVTCLKPMANHKGYALAFMIDMLCGPLNGMPFGPNIPPMYKDLENRRHLGSMVIAIDPKRFFGGNDFAESVKMMVHSAREQEFSNGEEPVLAPGDDHYKNEAQRLKSGIPVEPGLLEEINHWNIKLNLNYEIANV